MRIEATPNVDQKGHTTGQQFSHYIAWWFHQIIIDQYFVLILPFRNSPHFVHDGAFYEENSDKPDECFLPNILGVLLDII